MWSQARNDGLAMSWTQYHLRDIPQPKLSTTKKFWSIPRKLQFSSCTYNIKHWTNKMVPHRWTKSLYFFSQTVKDNIPLRKKQIAHITRGQKQDMTLKLSLGSRWNGLLKHLNTYKQNIRIVHCLDVILPAIFAEKVFKITWASPGRQMTNIQPCATIAIIIARHLWTVAFRGGNTYSYSPRQPKRVSR